MTSRILIADDEQNLRVTIAERLTRAGYKVFDAADGSAALDAARCRQIDVALLDLHMPGLTGVELIDKIRIDQPSCQIIVMTGFGTVETAVEAMKRGAIDYLQKPLRLSELDIVVEKAVRVAGSLRTSERMSAAVERVTDRGLLVGECSAMNRVREWIKRSAQTEQPVLIGGETGTGKELVARAIHQTSARAHSPFVAVNCGGLRSETLDNELFGHERGAFTSADRIKQGLFEIASGGTLFLDEIGEMRPESQIGLLRVIESRSFRRLGGVREIEVDLRVISATHRDLKQMVQSGSFREDLYYRLAVVEFEVPPLRQRIDDIPVLVRHFAAQSAGAIAATIEITGEALDLLRVHRWPGNVRELRNIVERLILLSGTEPVDKALVEGVLFGGQPADFDMKLALNPGTARRAVVQMDGNKSAAARHLGISRPTLYRLLNSAGED